MFGGVRSLGTIGKGKVPPVGQEMFALDEAGKIIPKTTAIRNREDIVRGMKPSTKATSQRIKEVFRPKMEAQLSKNWVQFLKSKGFTAESDKQLMSFVKKFYQEAPDDFVSFLKHIHIHGGPTDMNLRAGVRAAYSPYPRAALNFPRVVPGTTGGHEVKHALWDWIGVRMAENPSFSAKYPRLQSFMSRAEWDAPVLRRRWFNMTEEMKSMERRGLITHKEHVEAYKKFNSYYRKGIPEEAMANTFSRAWITEGQSMDEALKTAMKAGGRILEKQKGFRNAMLTEFNNWKNNLWKLTQMETEAGTVKGMMNLRSLRDKYAHLAKGPVKYYKPKSAVKGMIEEMPTPRLPQVKGAIGREKLAKQVDSILKKQGVPKNVVDDMMQYATPEQLKSLLKRFGGK
jgi:hypothetical protein